MNQRCNRRLRRQSKWLSRQSRSQTVIFAKRKGVAALVSNTQRPGSKSQQRDVTRSSV
jgi:hypothetical protein